VIKATGSGSADAPIGRVRARWERRCAYGVLRVCEARRCPVSDSLDGDDLRVITDSEVLAHLVERVGADHLAWINGESGGYEFADEQSTILGAFGGVTVGASTATPGQRRAVARFESGTGSVEMINGGVSGDVAWLV